MRSWRDAHPSWTHRIWREADVAVLGPAMRISNRRCCDQGLFDAAADVARAEIPALERRRVRRGRRLRVSADARRRAVPRGGVATPYLTPRRKTGSRTVLRVRPSTTGAPKPCGGGPDRGRAEAAGRRGGGRCPCRPRGGVARGAVSGRAGGGGPPAGGPLLGRRRLPTGGGRVGTRREEGRLPGAPVWAPTTCARGPNRTRTGEDRRGKPPPEGRSQPLNDREHQGNRIARCVGQDRDDDPLAR